MVTFDAPFLFLCTPDVAITPSSRLSISFTAIEASANVCNAKLQWRIRICILNGPGGGKSPSATPKINHSTQQSSVSPIANKTLQHFWLKKSNERGQRKLEHQRRRTYEKRTS